MLHIFEKFSPQCWFFRFVDKMDQHRIWYSLLFVHQSQLQKRQYFSRINHSKFKRNPLLKAEWLSLACAVSRFCSESFTSPGTKINIYGVWYLGVQVKIRAADLYGHLQWRLINWRVCKINRVLSNETSVLICGCIVMLGLFYTSH